MTCVALMSLQQSNCGISNRVKRQVYKRRVILPTVNTIIIQVTMKADFTFGSKTSNALLNHLQTKHKHVFATNFMKIERLKQQNASPTTRSTFFVLVDIEQTRQSCRDLTESQLVSNNHLSFVVLIINIKVCRANTTTKPST